MTLQQLKYALTIADCNSINEASKQLFISQPSLSETIRELETELGFDIFLRSNRGIVITPEGEEFLGYARQVTEQFGLPKEPILSTTALFASPFIGYNFAKEGSSVAQLKKNTRPIFLIHGDSDDFVPTSMLQKNYDAVKSTKEKWVVKNTHHANAYYTHPKEYARKVGKFFGKYLD